MQFLEFQELVKGRQVLMYKALKKMTWLRVLLGVALLTSLAQPAAAQDPDDPPARVARLGYMQGSVSFQPAGESDWVQAVPNRPMTTGDRLWADQDSRAEVELGSAVIRLSANTGFSFLNLDDRTVQIELTSGALNIRVRSLNRDDVFEVDTPNQAFSVFQRGRYRLEASEDGTYTVVSVREGEGESTGNGQTYTLHAGQRVTFSGTESLNAEVEEIGGPDEFDNWTYSRDRRYEQSRSAQYLSQDVVGYEDLDDHGDWRDDSNYGHVWFPNGVSTGWAPYREGHWDWISPWGWTWVDDASWGYAPFHYGRWVNVGDRWGWVAGPANIAAVYAPALVVFIGAGRSGGGNVGWFPLGPREVYVPSYNVSRSYVNRVNVSNTTVNETTITNVYNTTIVNKTTNITNVNYVNRQVAGAVTAVPQRTFISAQPVARAAVAINAREVASAPLSSRAAVAPSRESVLGSKANSVGHVTAPPPALATRQVVAKATPPPPPVPFARQQQVLAAHPGQPLARQEVQTLRPANTAAVHPMVKQAPPGKPATPIVGRPGTQPGNPSNAARPGQPASTAPAYKPGNQPALNERPGAEANPARPNNAPAPNRPPSAPPNNRSEPSRPEPNQPAPNNRLEVNRPPTPPPNNRPEPNRPEPNQPAPNNRPEVNRPPTPPPNNRPEPNRPEPNQPAPNNRPEVNRPPTAPPNNRPEPSRPEPNQPAPNNRPEVNRPPTPPPNNRPEPNRPEPNQTAPNNRPEVNRPPTAPPNNRPEPSRPAPNQSAPNNRPEASRPATPPSNRPEPNRPEPNQPAPNSRREPNRSEPAPQSQTPSPSERPQAKPQTPEEKKLQDEQRKRDTKPQPPPNSSPNFLE
jgi:hypothetical protein